MHDHIALATAVHALRPCTLPACPPLQDIPDPQLPADVTQAFDVAYNNIKAFHEAQRYQDMQVETMPGVTCRRVARPIGEHCAPAACCAVLHAVLCCAACCAASRGVTRPLRLHAVHRSAAAQQLYTLSHTGCSSWV